MDLINSAGKLLIYCVTLWEIYRESDGSNLYFGPKNETKLRKDLKNKTSVSPDVQILCHGVQINVSSSCCMSTDARWLLMLRVKLWLGHLISLSLVVITKYKVIIQCDDFCLFFICLMCHKALPVSVFFISIVVVWGPVLPVSLNSVVYIKVAVLQQL